MRYPGALPRFLLNGPLSARMAIILGASLAFLIVFLFMPATSGMHNPVLFIIPIALIAWMFRASGVYLVLFFLLIILWLHIVFSTGRGIWPGWDYFLSFSIGSLTLLIVGLLVSSQRNAFDLADEAQQQLYFAYEQQRKLHEARDHFLQNINHELRTPLTAIYGYLELLMEHKDTLKPETRDTFLEHAMQSCEELQILVGNVLDSMSESREKRQSIKLEQTVVIDVVNEVLERFDPKTLQKHTIRVKIPEYLVVLANPQYVRQVLRNLLSNAFKYSPADTPIDIEAALYGKTVDPFHPTPEICISVRDYGPGIPAEEIDLLFGQFVRLRRDTSSNVRGSGLGLFLSKLFVTMMGGRIWVESEGIPGKGSCFYFTLLCVPRPKVAPHVKTYQIYIPASIETSTVTGPTPVVRSTS